MKDSVIYVGIDVHKDTSSVCMYDRQDNAFLQRQSWMPKRIIWSGTWKRQ